MVGGGEAVWFRTDSRAGSSDQGRKEVCFLGNLDYITLEIWFNLYHVHYFARYILLLVYNIVICFWEARKDVGFFCHIVMLTEICFIVCVYMYAYKYVCDFHWNFYMEPLVILKSCHTYTQRYFQSVCKLRLLLYPPHCISYFRPFRFQVNILFIIVLEYLRCPWVSLSTLVIQVIGWWHPLQVCLAPYLMVPCITCLLCLTVRWAHPLMPGQLGVF